MPEWFNASRAAGWKRFRELRDAVAQATRSGASPPLGSWTSSGVTTAPEDARRAGVAVTGGLDERAARFVFVNDGAVLPAERVCPKGVICLPLEEALDARTGTWCRSIS